MNCRAYAKVNLSLEVVGKRPDGFHDLESIMQTVSLFDEIEIADDDDVRFACSDDALAGDDNLVPRAATLLRDRARSKMGCSLRLHKAIPHAAGLGGGSSDAAVTLQALSDRWSLTLSLPELVELGTCLGSDVPFFLHGGTALVAGRGDRVSPLPAPDLVWYALVKPPIAVRTRSVFNALSAADWTDGASTRAVAAEICDHRCVTLGVNGLQRSLFQLFPAARHCFETVHEAAPGRTFVSGSGPTVGALCGSKEQAEDVVARVAQPGWWTAVVQSTGPTGS